MQNRIAIGVLLMLAGVAFAAQKSLDELKTAADRAQGGHQAKLCSQLTQDLIPVADRQFSDGNADQGQATVREILKYAQLARDAAVKSHDQLKETEIRLRQTQRRLEAMKRTLSIEDRPPLDMTEKKIEQFRQDLLDAMFPPKKKG